MKTKKTSVVVTIIIVILCLLVLGLSFAPIGNAGDLETYFSEEEFNNMLSSLYFQGGTIGLLLGIAMYVGFVFVIVMFVVALCKKRGWFALLDLLALILGFRAAMCLAYWAMMNRDSVVAVIFAAILIVMCISVAILPLLCVTSDAESHATTVAPLPSTIPTVEKDGKAEEPTDASDKADEEPAADKAEEETAADKVEEEPEADKAEAEPATAAPAEEPVKEEASEETPVAEPEAKEEPAEDKSEPVTEEKETEPVVTDEKAAEPVEETPKEDPVIAPSETENDDKISKTEEKPMKAEKKTAKTAAPKAAAKTAAPKTAAKAAAAPKTAAKAATKSAAQKAQGKYEVYPEAGFFKYRLKANNGEILIVSNGYKTRDGAHKGIDTLVKAVASGVAKIIIDKNKFAQFRLYTASDSRLIVAGEYYPNSKGAQSALESVQKFYKTDKIVDLDEIPETEVREWRISLGEAENNGKGKFEIYVDETKKYRGRLLANNGQLLFATAAYAAKNGVTGALEKVQKKFGTKDVTVTCDKQGRYQFIVYADNGSVLVMGESYKSKDRAISAAQSSKNFSSNPTIVDVTKDGD